MQVRKKPYTTKLYLAELTLDEGLAFISKNNIVQPLFMFGERIKRDHNRFAVLRNCELKCCFCGIKATRFIIERHKNDKVMPYSVNVYAGTVMLTWDHILPKSHGGSDHVANGRVACGPCNEGRGNLLTLEDVLWVIKQDPELIFKREGPKSKPSLKKLIHQAKYPDFPLQSAKKRSHFDSWT